MAVALPILAAAPKGTVGGWKPIANPKAPAVVAIAKFAVAEHNKEKKTSLVFVSVVKGETQVVAGTNYRLVITAKDGHVVRTYTAVVFAGLGKQPLRLTSFV